MKEKRELAIFLVFFSAFLAYSNKEGCYGYPKLELSQGKLLVYELTPGPAGVTAKLPADCTLYCMIVADLLTC